MALTSRTKNVLVDKINTCFAAIGSSNGTKMPKSGNNRESVAWELWVASQLASLANKRKSNAEDTAIMMGVIFDKEKHPAPPGTKEVLFNGELVSVSVEVSQAAVRPNVHKLMNYLASKKVPRSLLDEAFEHSMTPSKPAHKFNSMLITNGN